MLAATLFGVGGTFAQFLFQQRGVNIDWLVTMRLLCAGPVLLLMAASRQGRAIFSIWRDDPMPIILFGLIGMMPVQYTYMAAIDAVHRSYVSPTMLRLAADYAIRDLSAR